MSYIRLASRARCLFDVGINMLVERLVSGLRTHPTAAQLQWTYLFGAAVISYRNPADGLRYSLVFYHQ